MPAVLLTGMSGVGKSTLIAELARRGHVTVETDRPEWLVTVEDEELWRLDRVATLLDEADRLPDRLTVVSGTVANQGELYRRFDVVVLLSAPVDVMLERLATRTTNHFGKSEAERAAILRDLEEIEPVLRAGCDLELDGRRPVEELADRIEALFH